MEPEMFIWTGVVSKRRFNAIQPNFEFILIGHGNLKDEKNFMRD